MPDATDEYPIQGRTSKLRVLEQRLHEVDPVRLEVVGVGVHNSSQAGQASRPCNLEIVILECVKGLESQKKDHT